MNKSSKFILVLALTAIAFGLAWAAPKQLADARGTYRLLGENRWIPLQSHAGRSVLLVFWASWCLPCVSEIPNLNAVYEKFEHSGLKIVAVSMDNTSDENLQRIVQRNRIRYPVVVPSEDLLREFRVEAIPASYLYDKNGKLVAEWIGPPSAEELERAINAALRGEAPPSGPTAPPHEK